MNPSPAVPAGSPGDGKKALKAALDVLLVGRLAPAGAILGESGGDLCLTVPPGHLKEAARALRDDPGTAIDFLACLTGMDHLPRTPRFELVYHLRSIARGYRMLLRTRLADGNPTVHSVAGIWGAADWFEREAFDLLGINFAGHPDLRRILLPAGWQGHPLRKDYPLEGEHAGEES